MKKILSGLFVVVMAGTLSSCACVLPTGALYTEVSSPVATAGGTDLSYSKVGTSKATSYFGLIATGDASIKAAIDNGQLKKVKFVDYSSKNILGIVGEYTTTAYGD